MRAKFLLLGIAVLPLVVGCNSATSGPETPPATPPPAADQPTAAATAPKTNVLNQVELPAAQVVNKDLTPPDSVKLSPAALEVAKMARAGVDDSVMVAYVVNSVNTYNLSADEIVYLKDLGLAPDVVSAMIQHDQQIREASLNGAMAASPATPGPAISVWSNGTITSASNVWQEIAPAPAPEAEGQTTVPPPPEEERPPEVTVDYFYDSLAPYGTWIDIDGYGRCWRPTVVASTPGWRPYVHGGRWVWTDAGWYWYSDYSWGWAPFHYGRWFVDARWGWCWMPGSEWGPSWVSWRYDDSYCGWAPLPPAAYYYPTVGFTYYGQSCGAGFSFGLTWDCFTFVSYNRFCGRYYDRYCAPRHQTPHIYNNSTVVNNVIVGDNNTIINQGVAPDRISAITRSEISRASVRQTSGGQPGGGRNETLAPDGSTVTVVQHRVPGGRAPTRFASTSKPAAEPITTPAPTQAPAAPTRGETARPRGGSLTVRGGPAKGANPNASASMPAANSSSVSAAPAANAAATTGDPSANSTSRPGVRRTPGALYIRGNPNPPATAQVTPEPSAVPSATTSATPWLNNRSSSAVGRTPRPDWQANGRNDDQPDANESRPGRYENPSSDRDSGDHSGASSLAENSTSGFQPGRANQWQTTRPNNYSNRPTPRTRGNNGGSRDSFDEPASGRSVPNYSPAYSPPQSSGFSEAPVSRIERPAPAPHMSSPAPASPRQANAPVERPAQPSYQGGGGGNNSRSSSPAPAPAPAPTSRSSSSSSSSGNNGNSGSASSRPGR